MTRTYVLCEVAFKATVGIAVKIPAALYDVVHGLFYFFAVQGCNLFKFKKLYHLFPLLMLRVFRYGIYAECLEAEFRFMEWALAVVVGLDTLVFQKLLVVVDVVTLVVDLRSEYKTDGARREIVERSPYSGLYNQTLIGVVK